MQSGGWRARGVAIGLVLAACASGVAVRLTGIRHGEPSYIYHPDVPKQVTVAQLAYRGVLDLPARYGDRYDLSMYPYGTSVILGRCLRGFERAAAPFGVRPERLLQRSRWEWALMLRRTGVVLFAASLLAVLLAEARRMGLMALGLTGILLALEPLSAQYGHYGMNDAPMAALLLAAWRVSARMAGERVRRPWASLAAGALVGLAFGVKYQAVLGLVFPMTAWLLRRRDVRWLAASAAATAAGLLAGALFTCPQVADPGYFAAQFPRFLRWQADVTGEDLSVGRQVWLNVRLLARFGASTGFIVLLPAVAWGIAAARARRLPAGRRQLAASCALLLAAFLAVFVPFRDFIRSNDLLIALPFLVLLNGFMLDDLSGRGRKARWFLAAAGAAVALLWARVSSLDAAALARQDTRERAQAWCREHLPEGASVVREDYTLPVDRPDVKDRYQRLLAKGPAADAVRQGAYDAVIVSSLAFDRFFDRLSPYCDAEAQDFYRMVGREYRLRATFSDRPLEFAHPAVMIYGRPASNPK
jgi:hypothetical protein